MKEQTPQETEKGRMRKLVARWMCVAVLLSCAAPAWAQDDMEFGEGETEGMNENNPSEEFLEEGKKLYTKKNFVEASLLFYKILQSGEDDPSMEPFVAEATYELGKTLFRMEFYQGALDYFGRIVDTGDEHPYFEPTLRGLVLLTDEIPSDQGLLDRLTVYTEAFPKRIPKKYRNQFAYLVGRNLYNQGQYSEALRLLRSIKPSNKNFVRARYITGITHVANYDAKSAFRAFKDVLRVLVAKQESGDINKEEQQILELTYLAMARVFYSTKNYNKAIKYYSRISRDSPNWPAVLFETSWTYFQLDLANKALGNLHTLNSPFFTNAFFPEAPILAAVMFFYNCKYPRVRYELEEFELSYLPVKEEIEDLLKEYKDNDSEMFNWLNKLRTGKASGDEKLTRILAASTNDKQILRKLELIESIKKEGEKLKASPGTWRTSELGSSLSQDNQIAVELAKSETGSLVRARLKRVRDDLVNFNVNRERILFEVARAEKGEIDADLGAEMVVKRNVKGKAGIKVSDEQLYWTFDGEYWKDELGYYFLNINTECKR